MFLRHNLRIWRPLCKLNSFYQWATQKLTSRSRSKRTQSRLHVDLYNSLNDSEGKSLQFVFSNSKEQCVWEANSVSRGQETRYFMEEGCRVHKSSPLIRTVWARRSQFKSYHHISFTAVLILSSYLRHCLKSPISSSPEFCTDFHKLFF